MHRFVGDCRNFVTGKKFEFKLEYGLSYTDFNRNAYCLVLVDAGDDVIDPTEVEAAVKGVYKFYKFDGGSHRFEHLEQALPLIENYLNRAEVTYDISR